MGLAWDVANKTVVKGTFGRFVNGLDDGFANAYNPLANVTMTFKWRDLDGNRDYTPGEVNLDPNGLDFAGVTGTSSARLNPELKPTMTTEATVGVEREVVQNFGVRVLYVHKKVTDRFGTRNVARPRSAYNIPLTRRDPGPDGVLNTSDDGGSATIYDYDRAYFGAAFVQNEQQNSDRDDSFQTIEFTATKRSSGKWGAMASFWAIKNDFWLSLFEDDPNTDLNARDTTWKWAGNVSGNYSLPLGIQLGAFIQSKIGIQGQRTNVFRAVDPDGGRALSQLTTVTLKLDEPGAQKSAAIHVVNLRASKYLRAHGRQPRAIRLRRVQPVQRKLADYSQFRVGADVRLCHGGRAAAHRANRLPVYVLAVAERTLQPHDICSNPPVHAGLLPVHVRARVDSIRAGLPSHRRSRAPCGAGSRGRGRVVSEVFRGQDDGRSSRPPADR